MQYCTSRTQRLAALVVVALILLFVFVGGWVQDWQYRQEVRAAHSGPELTAEQYSVARAQSERTDDHLPTW